MNTASYDQLEEKFGAKIDFIPFYKTEPLTSLEFRAQRVNISDVTAVLFSARHTIDAFFQICEALRVKVPETMKYFCTTEAVAVYLQKHIVYRKRKIFFGDRTPQSILDQIGSKHKDEVFLITTSDSFNNEELLRLFDEAGLKYKTAMFVKNVPQDLSPVDLNSYDVAVVYNPADVKSIQTNYPQFEARNVKFFPFSRQAASALHDAGLPVIDPCHGQKAPSVAKAMEEYLKAN